VVIFLRKIIHFFTFTNVSAVCESSIILGSFVIDECERILNSTAMMLKVHWWQGTRTLP